jgi:putative pyruvate formate lyase activating enzyme
MTNVRLTFVGSGSIEHLPKYAEIVEGRRWPQYIHARRWGVTFDPEADTETLWAIHDEALREFHDSWVLDEPREKDQAPPSPADMNLLDLKIELARRLGEVCELCERRCRAERTRGKAGTCGVLESRVSSAFLHHGEEHELVPSHTVFFSGCNLECQFCQNHDISRHPRAGKALTPEACAKLVEKEGWGSRNVNWVGGDPIPNVPFILRVLRVMDGDRPRAQVFNSNMYMTEEVMRLLDGVVDVYLTDFKYGNDDCAKRLSHVEDYFAVVSRNHALAARQAELLVRHLVLPEHVDCCSIPVLDWLAANLGPVRVNVMDQYRPVYRANEHPDISQRLRTGEFLRAYRHAEELGHLGLD